MKILIIEDEPEMTRSITESLRREQYVVESAGSVSEAAEKLAMQEYSCILLDIGLPDGSGFEVLKIIRRMNLQHNVIIISALGALDDKLTGLELGADDYLTKPFHLAELNARIKAVLRRKAFSGHLQASIGNLTVDFNQHSVMVEQALVALNRKEFDILAYFIENKNRLVSKNSIAAHVWGDNADDADNFEFIYSQIKNLRKKLREHGADVEIKAVYGIGYKLSVPE